MNDIQERKRIHDQNFICLLLNMYERDLEVLKILLR